MCEKIFIAERMMIRHMQRTFKSHTYNTTYIRCIVILPVSGIFNFFEGLLLKRERNETETLALPVV